MNAQITTLNKEKSKGRDKKGRWLPGYCPNKNGRPKIDPAVREMAQGNISELVIYRLAEIAIDENNAYPKECQFFACVMLFDIGWGCYGKKVLKQELKIIGMTIREFIARFTPSRHPICSENNKGKYIDFYQLQERLAKQEVRRKRSNRLIFTDANLKSPSFLNYICPPPKWQKGKYKMKHWEPLRALGGNKVEVTNLSVLAAS